MKHLIPILICISLIPIMFGQALADEREELLPNIITIDDFGLYIEYILPDGTVTPAKPYKIKGVCWLPSSVGTSPYLGYGYRIREFKKWYKTDIPLMKEMG